MLGQFKIQAQILKLKKANPNKRLDLLFLGCALFFEKSTYDLVSFFDKKWTKNSEKNTLYVAKVCKSNLLNNFIFLTVTSVCFLQHFFIKKIRKKRNKLSFFQFLLKN